MFSCRCVFSRTPPTSRAFSATTGQWAKPSPTTSALDTAKSPLYPYGPSQWYKQSNKGLYGGTRVRFGNNVSEKTKIKTRRTWHPNVMRKKIFSEALNRPIRVRVSMRVLRTIDKVGGLDEYLLGEKSGRIKNLGVAGWRLRCMVMSTRVVQERLNRQRAELGLPLVDYKDIARQLEDVDKELEMARSGSQPYIEESAEDGEFEVEEMLEEPADGTVRIEAPVIEEVRLS